MRIFSTFLVNTDSTKKIYIKPKGMIIGVCNLINCLKVTEDAQGYAVLEDRRIVRGNDYLLGDFRV
jgi:hypothetical protein